ncbi:GNAT family N-acetyltransferase [Glutamicibacter sp.]
MWCLPSAHGQGAGAALMRAALEHIGRREVRLEFVKGNDRASRFYERF